MKLKHSLKFPQALKSRTLWSLIFTGVVELASALHPASAIAHRLLSFLGIGAAAYFRMFPRQIATPVDQKLIAEAIQVYLHADHQIQLDLQAVPEDSVPVSTDLNTFGAPPAERKVE